MVSRNECQIDVSGGFSNDRNLRYHFLKIWRQTKRNKKQKIAINRKISQLNSNPTIQPLPFAVGFAPKGVLRRVAMRACGCQLASSLAENHPKKNQGDIRQDPEFHPERLILRRCWSFYFLGGGRVRKTNLRILQQKKIRGHEIWDQPSQKKQGDNFWRGKSVKIANIFSIKFHLLRSGAYNHPLCTTIVVKKVQNNHPATRPTLHTSTVPSLSRPERFQKHAETLKVGIRWNSKSLPFLIGM